MKDRNLCTIVELALLKNDEPEEYEKLRSLIKEVVKDVARLEVEIIEELEAETKEKKKKEKEDLDLRIAEKMKRDTRRT